MKGNIQVQTRKLDSFIYNVGIPTLYVYQGTMPSNSSSFVLASNSSNLLMSFGPLSANWIVRDSASTTLTRAYMNVFPGSTAAIASGTATWFCLYTSSTIFMLGDVSNTTGTSILQLLTTTITSGIQYDVYSFAFELDQ